MRKKKFAGLLMLTAAVALGTVSPVALPNTVAIVKANLVIQMRLIIQPLHYQ